jgi:arabinogalactan endo-1,4-beta-galactosidase
VDLSFLDQLEQNGAVYLDAGIPMDALTIFQNHGINTVRLRLWHTPPAPYNNLERTLVMARRIKAVGLSLLLDFHFSDTWADPGRQTPPVAWQGLDATTLADSVRTYTTRVMQALMHQQTLPDYVQFGNEIISGMLWNTGRVGGSFDTTPQWQQLAGLLTAAVEGLDTVVASDERPLVMIHIDRGGDSGGARWFFDHLTAQGFEFDLIGLSYYPWWHGRLSDVTRTLNDLAARYGKPMVIVETAYPWTLGWFDNVNNLVGLPGHLHPGYDADAEGQEVFLQDLRSVIEAAPDGLGRGLVYWAPDYIAVQGVGSSWENVALFDNNGNLLPAVDALGTATGVGVEPNSRSRSSGRIISVYPNPFSNRARIQYELSTSDAVQVEVYDLLGRRVLSTGFSVQTSGRHECMLDGSTLVSGAYVVWITGARTQAAALVIRD